jgi:hypothetical protein
VALYTNRTKDLQWQAGTIITLKDMQEFSAKAIINVTAHLKHFADVSIGESHRGKWSNGEQKKLKDGLGSILSDLQLLELPSVYRMCILSIKDIDLPNPCAAKGRAISLRDLFNSELESRNFLFIPEDKIDFFKNKSPFDEGGKFEVLQNFPIATAEAEKASKCFALDQFTACVFHLMRVMEVALRVFSKNVLPANSVPVIYRDRNWGSMLKALKVLIDNNNSKKPNPPAPTDWPKRKHFCENTYAFIEGVRNPWRNGTMHIERDYNEQEALEIFNAVKALMRNLATELKE